MKGAITAIMKKDIRQVFSSRQTMIPMIVVPLVFAVFIPLTILFPSLGSLNAMTGMASNTDISVYLNALAGNSQILAEVKALPGADMQMAYLFVNYLFMPMFVLIPVMTSGIIAASSVVGEKEKKTMETLLYAPVPMGKMFWAKVMAAFLPGIALTAIAVAIYGCIVNFSLHDAIGRYIFPTSNWIVFLLLLTPAFSLLATILMVFVSAKAKTFQSAQQWSVIIVLPVIGIMMAQTTGAFFVSPAMFALIGAAVIALDVVLVFQGLGRFTRQKLIQ
jgi:ABC-type transport system involved in multi-copper enzyme maturation permease subunit